MAYRSQALDPAVHVLDDFTSGEESLDGWLRGHAVAAQKRGTSRVWVWVEDDDPGAEGVVAYYTLSAHEIRSEGLTAKLARGMPRVVPAYLLGRLALDQTMHGQGVGGALLADALGRAVTASHLAGARFVVVDALSEKAAAFYEHFGFTRLPDSMRLVRRITDIEADGVAASSS